MENNYLVLFSNVNDGMALYQAMQEAGMACSVSFSPKKVEAVCGITVRFQGADQVSAVYDLAQAKDIAIKEIIEDEGDA